MKRSKNSLLRAQEDRVFSLVVSSAAALLRSNRALLETKHFLLSKRFVFQFFVNFRLDARAVPTVSHKEPPISNPKQMKRIKKPSVKKKKIAVKKRKPAKARTISRKKKKKGVVPVSFMNLTF